MSPSRSTSINTEELTHYTADELILPNNETDSLSTISALSPTSIEAINRLARFRPPDPTQIDRYPHPEGRAAVLVCLFGNRTGTNLNVLLTTRAETLRTFPGQVALPGGKMDASDINLEATARREAWEEVGIPIDTHRIRYLTTLPPFLMRNLSLVTPVVVLLLDYSLKPELNRSEVSQLFSFPLEGFLLSEPRPPVFREPPRSTVDSEVEEDDVDEQTEPDSPSTYAISASKKTTPTTATTTRRRRRTIPGKPYHVEEDYVWYEGRRHRFHSFEADPRPITGVTAEMLIHVAMIAYGRKPEFQLQAPEEMSHRELIDYAIENDSRWITVREEQKERERLRREMEQVQREAKKEGIKGNGAAKL